MSDTLIEATTVIDAREGRALPRIPRASYRLQFNPSFTFADAQALIDYLDMLGISDCYASPIFKARAGSMHGYDICDHSKISPALGGKVAFDTFTTALRDRGMGLILDVVPNHMGIGDACNHWWMDVLENGPGSIYANHFDIDWNPVRTEIVNKVLLPILEDQYGTVLEDGKLRLVYEEGTFCIFHYETKLPVTPDSYSQILSYRLDELVEALGETNEYLQEYQSILTALNYLPPNTDQNPEKVAERNREKEVIKRRIDTLHRACPEVRSVIESTVEEFNGVVGVPSSFDLLDKLIDEQSYRPAFWRVATEEINYRRFFDINELAAIRVELPEVFEATHHLVFQLIAEGRVTGLRIDHPDGLWDPPKYFRQLQDYYIAALQQVTDREDQEQTEPSQLSLQTIGPIYVVAEKILSMGETLPQDWEVAGTTGYDFLNGTIGLFIERQNRFVFDKIYNEFLEGAPKFHHLTNSTRKMIMLVSLSSEINELSSQLDRLSAKNRRYRDFTLNSLTFAIREVVACLPVYRTYINGPDSVTLWDARYIEAAVAEAKRRNPRTAEAIFNFIRDTLLLRNLPVFAEEDQPKLVDFVMKFQQISGPVMAKGVEDTAFYVYNRLVSLNEVGGHPDQFGVTVPEFHQHNSQRLQLWPHAMLSTSTHDTKRSEDVRARISVLSEMPDEWSAALARWSELNADKKTTVDAEAAPDRNDEYLLYQTLLGTWPLEVYHSDSPEEEAARATTFAQFRDRITEYMHKATKEGKVHTSWVNPNSTYDSAVAQFVSGILDTTAPNPFLDDIRAFQRRISFYGQFNALSTVVLKCTSPGVPDIYQGNEIWDFSLVDPDNRRAVDYQQRQEMLEHVRAHSDLAGDERAEFLTDLLQYSHDGRIKLYVTYQCLNFRRVNHQIFTHGDYSVLEARGEKHEHVCAFARQFADTTMIVVVPRLVVTLTNGVEQLPLGAEVWSDTWLDLPYEQAGWVYQDLMTGRKLSVGERDGAPGLALADMFDRFPVVLLVRQSIS